jgi:hypothetical protein
LSGVLHKAQSYAQSKKLEDSVLLQLRLFPDMFPLVRQVQIAADFAKGPCARLADVEVPKMEDKEQSFEELQTRIATTLSFIDSLAAAKFEGAQSREVVLQVGTPKERKFAGGQEYLLHYALPHFFFHVSTAYGILRHNGVDIGKKDYLGNYQGQS